MSKSERGVFILKKSSLYFKAVINIVLYIIFALLVILLLPRVLVFFWPFLIGWLVSVIANPSVRFFEHKIKFKRKASSAILIVLIIAIILLAGYGVIAFLVNQCAGFIDSIDEKWPAWQKTFNNLGNYLNKNSELLPESFKETFSNLGGAIETAAQDFISNIGKAEGKTGIMSSISSGIGSVASALVGIIMCVLSAYLFTVEHDYIAAKLEKFLPENVFEKLMAAYRGLGNAVGGYFKAQFRIELWVFLITLIGLLICRVDYAVVIALGIAIMDFLPFFGAGIIMVPWAIISLVNANYFVGIGLLITWGVGQLVRQLIQPKIMGDTVGLSPLPTLFILFLGYKVSSVIGMILAIPVAMIFLSLYKEGVFDTFTGSVKILWRGLNELRKMPEEDEKQ